MENNFNQYLIEQLSNKKEVCDVKQFKELQKEYYKICHDNCNLKVGDKVKLTRVWTVEEYCTPILFYPQFLEYVGNTFEIKEKWNLSYELNNGIDVPYFVLEKVEEDSVPLDYNDDLVGKIVVSKDSNIKKLIVAQNENGFFYWWK